MRYELHYGTPSRATDALTAIPLGTAFGGAGMRTADPVIGLAITALMSRIGHRAP